MEEITMNDVTNMFDMLYTVADKLITGNVTNRPSADRQIGIIEAFSIEKIKKGDINE